MRTAQRLDERDPSPPTTGLWLTRAWLAVVSIPVLFLIAFAVGEGMYAMLGYKPENADAPVWVVIVALIPVLLIVLAPCVAAVLAGRRAVAQGDRRGRYPQIVGALAGIAILTLTVVSEVGNVVRR